MPPKPTPAPNSVEGFTANSGVVQHETLNPHSVELNRAASGVITITVKSYGRTIEEAQAMSVRVFNELHQKYPYSKP